MIKKLLILALLISFCGTVDAQKRYTRKSKKVQRSDAEEVMMDEDDMDEEEEITEVTISTKAMGKYLGKRSCGDRDRGPVTFEPMMLLGWNGIDVDNSEGNVLSGASDYSDMNFKAGTSWYVGLYPLGIKVNLYEHQLNLVTGMGVQFYNYKFNDSVVFSTDDPYFTEYYQPDMLKKTKLGSSYLSIPLLLEYNTPRIHGKSNFSIAGGMIFGYRLKTWTKMKLDNGSRLNGPSGNYNFNDFVYSVAFMVGFKDVKLFGTYQLNPMHRENPGYNVNAYPFSFGLML